MRTGTSTFAGRMPLLAGLVGMALCLSGCGVGRAELFKGQDRGSSDAPPPAPSRDDEPTTDDGEDTDAPRGNTSYAPIAMDESFDDMRARKIAAKADIAALQAAELASRYDMSDRPGAATMVRGKAVQDGVRVKTPTGVTWDQLALLSAAEIKNKGLFPRGFLPLPHPDQAEGGQVLPKFHIDEIKRQEGRDLQRFDVDLDIPDHLLPEFPAAIFLTNRPDLGDVSNGELVTIKNYFRLFDGILTPRQLDGLRLLVTPFAQQQFNLTDDRRVDEPQLGISCFDCHANGHTNGATHLDPQTRPQESRRRLDVPTLRGMNIQRLFGSQRALRSVEDFTEFEQLGAYFDGDQTAAAKKGFNKLDRALQVAHMGEIQSMLDFPPAPKLDVDGRLDPELATEAELRGQDLFFGKADCASCHVPPYYTDNSMHDLKADRFYKPQMVNGRWASKDGPIKTFPLRGIKDTPPYLHDGRLLTLADTVEYFNLILNRKLTEQEKQDVVAFLLTL